MKRSLLIILPLAAPACDAGGPTEPEGITVTIALTNPVEVERPDSLLLAVVWRTDPASGTPWLTTFDRPVSATAERHPVRVELPGGVNLGELIDAIDITFQCDEQASSRIWPGITPLWAAYQDLDGDGHLTGVDRVVAVTDLAREHLAAFADLEDVVAQLSLEHAECLGRFNGGGFSPFVSGLGSQLLYASPSPAFEFTLALSPTRYPAEFLTCGRALTWSEPQPDSPPLLSVAAGLAPDACAQAEDHCTRVEYQDDWRSMTDFISVPGYHRTAQCVTAGELQVLWVREQADECEGCACVPHLLDRGWVVSRDEPPSDWPCGASVETCATAADRVEVIPGDCPM